MTKIGTNNKKDFKAEIQEDDVLDGGWGWVVCVGTFLANFIADGTMFSSGVQMLAFLDYFGESKAATAWVSSTQLGLSMMMGPVVSFFIAKYSVRTVTMAGGVIAFLGTLAGTFSPNITVLIFTYGIICGIGICLFFISSIVAVGLYFTKKRAIATGMATSGSGLGVIIYPYLTESLFTIYDWRNTLLIIAGLCLNATVCGALFRPLTKKKSFSAPCDCLDENSAQYRDAEEKRPMLVPCDSGLVLDKIISDKMYNSASNIENTGNHLSGPAFRVVGGPSCFEVSGVSAVERVKINDRKYYSDQNIHVAHVSSHKHKTESHHFLSPNLHNDVFYSGSIYRLPFQRSGTILSKKDDLDCDDSAISSDLDSSNKCESNMILIQSCIAMLKQPAFLLLLFCMILWTAQSITMTYIPDMAVSKGIARNQAAMLISIIGITNTVVRVMAGFIVDIFHIRSLYLYICAIALGAVANIVLPWCESFPLMAVCSVGFGFCMGTVVCLRTILIADILGIEQLTQAFGIIAFFQGLAFSVNPPFAGFLFDRTNSYVYPFLLAGCYYIIALILCILLTCCPRHKLVRDTSFDVESADSATEHSND